MSYQPLDFEGRAYRPRDFTEAQLLLHALVAEIHATYGYSSTWARRGVRVATLETFLLGRDHPFCASGLLDVELVSDRGNSIAGVAWIEVNALGHVVYCQAFHAPSADNEHGWTDPTDFLGTTDLGRTLRDWLS